MAQWTDCHELQVEATRDKTKRVWGSGRGAALPLIKISKSDQCACVCVRLYVCVRVCVSFSVSTLQCATDAHIHVCLCPPESIWLIEKEVVFQQEKMNCGKSIDLDKNGLLSPKYTRRVQCHLVLVTSFIYYKGCTVVTWPNQMECFMSPWHSLSSGILGNRPLKKGLKMKAFPKKENLEGYWMNTSVSVARKMSRSDFFTTIPSCCSVLCEPRETHRLP